MSKLQLAVKNLIKEYQEGGREDSIQYAETIVNGINWTVEVYNGSKEYLNEKEPLMKKEIVNQLLEDFSNTYNKADEQMLAKLFQQDILVYLELFMKAIEMRRLQK